eukprot:810046-Rhodomonas_salina.2
MQLPSELAVTNSMSLPRTLMQFTVALCSFMLPNITRLSAVTRHTRTDPSNPPDTSRSGSLAHAIAVTPPTCASLITYSSFPDCGPNALIFPSLHPLRIARPSREKQMQSQSRFGICTHLRVSSSASPAHSRRRRARRPRTSKSRTASTSDPTPNPSTGHRASQHRHRTCSTPTLGVTQPQHRAYLDAEKLGAGARVPDADVLLRRRGKELRVAGGIDHVVDLGAVAGRAKLRGQPLVLDHKG